MLRRPDLDEYGRPVSILAEKYPKQPSSVAKNSYGKDGIHFRCEKGR